MTMLSRMSEKGKVFVEKREGFFSSSWKTEGGPVVWQKAAWTPLVGEEVRKCNVA